MIFFFYGPNTFELRRKLREMAATYAAKTGSDFGIERIDGSAAGEQELRSALTAVPFLATSRLVIIEGLSQNKTLAREIGSIIEAVPETTVAVFVEPEIDQRTVLFKELSKRARVAKFNQLSQPQLAAWAKRELVRYQASIEPRALNLLIEAVGEDQWRLEQEILKLTNYNQAVTAEHVRELVEPSYQQTIFDLVDAVVAGSAKTALTLYRRLLADRTNELYILTMIIWQLRNLLLAKTAGRVSAAELARQAKMSPFVAGRALANQDKFDLEQLKAAFLAALETDYAIKTGEGEPDLLVERLIYRLTAV